MVKRATAADVAREAGVSPATVDRVINGRLPVREDTVRKVLDAAQKVGFHATGLIRSRLRDSLPKVRIGILLQKPTDQFYAELTNILEHAIRSNRLYNGVTIMDYWGRDDGTEIAERLRKLADRCDAVAIVSPDHPPVAEAVGDIVASGKPVFSLLSDLAVDKRTSFLGIDARAAGRTAGWMIAQVCRRPGKVAVFIGSQKFMGHEMREMGLRSYFRERAPQFSVIDTLVNAESDKATFDAVTNLLRTTPDLVGIYVTGGGMNGGIEALRHLPANQRPALVCMSLRPETRLGLEDGIVKLAINEPTTRIAERLAAMAFQAIDAPEERIPHQVLLPFELCTPENL